MARPSKTDKARRERSLAAKKGWETRRKRQLKDDRHHARSKARKARERQRKIAALTKCPGLSGECVLKKGHRGRHRRRREYPESYGLPKREKVQKSKADRAKKKIAQASRPLERSKAPKAKKKKPPSRKGQPTPKRFKRTPPKGIVVKKRYRIKKRDLNRAKRLLRDHEMLRQITGKTEREVQRIERKISELGGLESARGYAEFMFEFFDVEPPETYAEIYSAGSE